MRVTRHPLYASDPNRTVDSVPLDLELIARLESSLARINVAGGEFTRRFYDALFAAQPGLRRMFPSDLTLQRKKLLHMLQWVVATLRDPAAVRSQLAELGARHAAYGATLEHYPAVVRELVDAMARVSGPHWSADLEKDWTDALQLVSEIMLRGGARAGTSPTPGA